MASPNGTDAPADQAVDQAELQLPPRSLLQQYADEVGADLSSIDAPPEPEPVATGEDQAAPPVEAPPSPSIDLDALLRDPTAGPRVRSIIDKSVNTYTQANRQAWEQKARADWEAREQERVRQQELDRIEAEMEEMEMLAARDDAEADYDEDVTKARKQVAQSRYRERLQARMRRDLQAELADTTRQQIAAEVEKQAYQRAGQNLAAQYQQAYAQIPEFQDPEILQQIHHDRFQSGTDWLLAMAEVMRQRAATQADAGAQARARELADQQTTMAMAEHRARLGAQPGMSPDVVPVIREGGSGMAIQNGYRGWRTLDEVNWAYRRGEASAQDVRQAQAMNAQGLLPFDDGQSGI